MARYFERELDRLKTNFLGLSGLVEENYHRAIDALKRKDENLAAKVRQFDKDIDQAEVDLEEDCLQLLTLYQPFARDLRYIVAILKINNDLERIGDLATNLAKRAVSFSHYSYNLPPEFADMAEKVGKMISDVLDAFSREDLELAKQVLHRDDAVDELNSVIYNLVRQRLQESLPPDETGAMIHLLTVSRQLERTADHVTNIAEDVIYYLEGSIVRHMSVN